jgi:hypothetical protein
MSVTIKFRRGNSSEWTSNGTTILASGEPGYELDTGRFKIGDGATTWNSLSYSTIVPSGFLSGSGININRGTNGSSATISVSGLNSSYISDFNSSVSWLLPVKNIVASTGISVTSSSGIYTITSTGSGIIADQASSLVTTVFNKTGSSIPKMRAVYIDGGQGDQPTVQLAVATGDVTSAGTYGLTYEAIDNMQTGKVIVFGALTGVNTDPAHGGIAGAVEGSVLYLSPITSGTITTTKPYAPYHVVTIGTVIRVHQNEGVIEVRIQNGFELEELHNVATTGATNNQAIIYNSASGLWMNTTLTSSLISDFNEAVDDRIGSGLFVAGTGINLNYSDSGNAFTVSVTGLINNPANNRILTSRDSTTTGIDAESNLTFDGTNLVVSSGLTASTGNFIVSVTGALLNIDNIRIDGNTITSTDPNGNLIIQSTGTGALQRTITGDARGQYAVDLQSSRTSGNQVAAANYSIIGGGRNNLISIDIEHGVIVGGFNNQFSATNGSTHFIGGGKDNKIDSNYSYGSSIVGGYKNTIGSGLGETSNYSFIGGGYQNTIGGYYNQSSFIGGGYQNKISSSAGSPTHISTVICGGNNNICSGNYSAILGGQSNNDGGKNNVFILGSSITGVQPNTTYVQNLDVSTTGDIDVLRINKFYHNNLSVATGVADSNLLITIVDPTGTPSTQVISGSGLRSSLLNQPAVLRFRQGTNAERLLITPASGEPIWTTDTQNFYIGDGTTVGGDFMGPSPYARSSGTQSISALNTSCVASGNYSVVVAGTGNIIGSNSSGGVIGGGFANSLSNTNTSVVIGGGSKNIISGSNTDYSTVCGGYNNRVTGNNSDGSTIGGGRDNTISATDTGNSTIAGGENNIISGSSMGSPTIGGGFYNTISGYSSDAMTICGGTYNNMTTSAYTNGWSIGGGNGNSISGDRSYHTIGGGYGNNIDSQGYGGSTIAGGYSNNITGDYSGGSVIGGGHENTIGVGGANGYFSTIGGGYGNQIAGNDYSTIPGGYYARATRYGELSHAAGKFISAGDAQHTVLIARRLTTDATANQVLFLDGNSLRLTIPAKTTWAFEIKLSAYNDTDSAGAGWIFRGAIQRNGSNGTALIGTVITENWQDSAMSSTSASVVADDTNEALEIRVTGITSKNIRWVAVVDISQVSYGTP